MGERPSEYERDIHDWYVEPEWCVTALRNRVDFSGLVHDPCCGMGTIPKIMRGSGADLVDRGFGYPVRNFLEDVRVYDNIVTNPPYGIAQEIIKRALEYSRCKVAALVQTKFLSSQKRHDLFMLRETESVIMFSRRPSMPPGEMLMKHGEEIRGGGSIDYCWVVWNKEHTGGCKISWVI
jgi:hypothetical protein